MERTGSVPAAYRQIQGSGHGAPQIKDELNKDPKAVAINGREFKVSLGLSCKGTHLGADPSKQ